MKKTLGLIPIYITLALTLTPSTSAQDSISKPLIGEASVIDGDTIEIEGTRIRFHGIDAPESRQTCLQDNKVSVECGKEAALALSNFLGRNTVLCKALKTDRYNRIIARCEVDGKDVEAWMVSNGYAVAYRRYSKEYIADEEAARVAKRGLWKTAFEMPWDWRKKNRR